MGSAAPELAACPPRIWGHLQPTQHPGESIAATAASEFWQTGEEGGGGDQNEAPNSPQKPHFSGSPHRKKAGQISLTRLSR